MQGLLQPKEPARVRVGQRLAVSSSASSLDEVCVVDAASPSTLRPTLPIFQPAAGGTAGASGPSGSSGPLAERETQGYYGVHYQRYAVKQYVDLPCALQPFMSLPGLSSFLVVGRPTMDISAGLAHYGAVVPWGELLTAPLVVVVDKPNMLCPSDQYYWVEFPLPDVFKLDVSRLHSFDDYVNTHLRKRHRRAFHVRQNEIQGSPLVVEYAPLRAGQRELVDEVWPLYLKTSQRHGHNVTSRADFYRIHCSGTRGLGLLTMRDTSRNNQLVTFCTGVRTDDTLMLMWCGTDYDNPLSRSCSTYINAQYEFIRIAIETPGVRWLDLGAQLRQMKQGVGASGYPVAGYMRCSNKLMRAMVTRMMQDYFDPSKHLRDA